ncbi:uncharacterized protein [Spinacia oleracea]|uniref:Ubiquitin-like protease family profile domain-containing protein n=1 Tax=Spinacia oleracea TaxID=3562 RepID=A0ABM3QWX9_SPIOL|nr:uncharacterized protein LOC130462910 [Spinacia oleracea]
MYHIDNNPLKKKYVMAHLSDRFRDWKAKLVSGHITKTRKISPNAKPPYLVYEAITEEIWQQFVAAKTTDTFKEISEKARKSQSHNLHPHFMGQKSYSQKETEWEVEGRYPSVGSTDSTMRKRHLNWIFGRQKKNEKGEYVFPKDEARLVGEKIDKEVQEVEQGIWTPHRQDDVLSRSLGKKDRRGRVVAVGGTIGHQAYWGKPVRNNGEYDHFSQAELKKIEGDFEAKIEQVRKETIAMMEKKMEAVVEEKFINLVTKLGLKLPVGMEIGKTTTTTTTTRSRSNSPSVELEPNSDPFAELKSPLACRLCQLDDSQQLVVVARGVAYPFNAEDVVHHSAMKPGYLKVSVNSCVPGYETAPLPVPNLEMKDVGGAVKSFVQWPRKLIIGDKEFVPRRKMSSDQPLAINVAVSSDIVVEPDSSMKLKVQDKRDKEKIVDTQNTVEFTMERTPLVSHSVMKHLSESCKRLANILTDLPPGVESISFQLDAEVFGYKENFSSYISKEDVVQLLSGAWLNISTIQIFIRALHEKCKNLSVDSITFMCPQLISATTLLASSENIDEACEYMARVMKAASENNQKILAPYHQNNHWVLLVIYPTINTVHVFDSIKKKRSLAIRVVLDR